MVVVGKKAQKFPLLSILDSFLFKKLFFGSVLVLEAFIVQIIPKIIIIIIIIITTFTTIATFTTIFFFERMGFLGGEEGSWGREHYFLLLVFSFHFIFFILLDFQERFS